jgi:hypothetical protein
MPGDPEPFISVRAVTLNPVAGYPAFPIYGGRGAIIGRRFIGLNRAIIMVIDPWGRKQTPQDKGRADAYGYTGPKTIRIRRGGGCKKGCGQGQG